MVNSHTNSGVRFWDEKVITPEDVGTYQVGDTWVYTFTLLHDGNGNLMQTPRIITFKIEPVRDEDSL